MRAYLFRVSCFMLHASCFLLLASSAYAASFDPALKWRTIKTDHFEIHFVDSIELQANKTAGYLEEAHAKLSPKLGWKPHGRTQIILTDNSDSANGTASTLPYNWINLRITAPKPESVLGDYDNWLRTLIFHEYTHILHIDQYGGVMKLPRWLFGKVVSPNGTVPGWMREGIATYDETAETTRGRGRSSYSEMMLRTAILSDKFPKIDQADGLGWRWPSYQAMYIYGVKFLQYIADTYGEDKLMEFHDRMGKSPWLYAVNRQAKKTFGRSFYKLWNDWKVSLEKKYAEEKVSISAEGLTEFEDVAAGGTVLSSPAISPDGKYLAYARVRVKGPTELHLMELDTKINKVIRKKQLATGISFSPDSKKVVYSAAGAYKTYNAYSDLHIYDIETGKFEQLTKGERASDPAFSPDGKNIVFVKQDAGRSWLAVYDVEKKEIVCHPSESGDPVCSMDSSVRGNDSSFFNAGFTQFSAPAWSPDGKLIAVSSWQPNLGCGVAPFRVRQSAQPEGCYSKGQWDIYIYDTTTGAKVAQLTNDTAIDSHPTWSPDGKTLYFASDRSGISNIYMIPPFGKGGAVGIYTDRVTNVLTGAFQPALSPDGKTLYVQYYNGEGFDVRRADIQACRSVGVQTCRRIDKVTTTRLHDYTTTRFDHVIIPQDLQMPNKKYSAFGKSLFLPRFIIPSVATLDNAVYLSAFTGGADPLRRHNWLGGVNYRTDLSSYTGYFFNYWYSRYKPVFSLGMMAYPVKYSSYSFCTATNGLGVCTSSYSKNLFEERLRGYGGISLPWGKNSFGLSYFFEDRKSNLTDGEFNALANISSEPNLGRYAGAVISYNYGHVERYSASISNEKGRKLKTNFAITDKMTGSSESNEQRIFIGDYREYVSLPWQNHVLALRTHGGMTWGDELNQGTFSLGGALGEGMMGGGDSLYYFPLRGLPIAALARTRALLFSGEYRIPLAAPQRGLGTTPFYIKNIHFAPFADYGNAWNASTNMWGEGMHFLDNFFLSAGAELRSDFVIGHGLPVTGRVGYAIVVVNRDRLGTVTDPLLGTSVRNGMLVLQLGTAF